MAPNSNAAKEEIGLGKETALIGASRLG